MIIIKKCNVTFTKVIANQMSADDTYRLLTYCLCQNIDDGVLLYNTLSSEMVLLSKTEAETMLTNEYLCKHWFVVPEHFDDKQFAQQYREVRKLLQPKTAGISGYTIMTTMDCNARCFYCYELGRKRTPMSAETARKVAQYIVNNYNNLPQGDKPDVNIAWFGGEPLYNSNVIDIISQKLIEANVPFRSKMISNGYLFDEELIKKAKSLWNLRRVQITLDGTESTYNRSKNFIYQNGSAYQRVIRNIGLLLDADIRVVVRLNMDVHNDSNLIELINELHQRFDNKKKLSVYCHPLFETAGHTEQIRSGERRMRVYDAQLKIEALLMEKGFLKPRSLPRDIATSKCMADSGRSRVIAPTGDIGLCEHYSESEFCSHVDTPKTEDRDVIASFIERYADEPLCDSCAYYPLCIRLKKCEEDRFCFPEIKELNLMRTRKSMLKAYADYLKKHGAEDAEEDESDDINVEC